MRISDLPYADGWARVNSDGGPLAVCLRGEETGVFLDITLSKAPCSHARAKESVT